MSTALTPKPVVSTVHAGGARFATTVRGHEIFTDQPVRGNGADSAPSPLELLSAALGACIALYVQRFCESRELPTDGLKVEVIPYWADAPGRLARFDVEVIIPEGIPDRFHPLIERVARSCPAHHTLSQPPEFGVVVRPREAMAAGG